MHLLKENDIDFFKQQRFKFFRSYLFITQAVIFLKIYYFKSLILKPYPSLEYDISALAVLLTILVSLSLIFIPSRLLYYLNYLLLVLSIKCIAVVCETEKVALSIAFSFILIDIYQKILKNKFYLSVKQINCIFLSLTVGILYFDASISKMLDPIWLKGEAIWSLSSMPFTNLWSMGFILDFKWLLRFLTFLTLIIEFFFIFAIWSDKWRGAFIIGGLFLQFGIAVVYPVQLFALITAAPMLIFCDVRKKNRFQNEDNLHRPILKNFYALFILLSLQSIFILQHERFSSNIVRNINKNLNFIKKEFITPLTGIKWHPLMAQHRFQNYPFLIAIKKDNKNLPIVDEDGFASLLYSGRMWNYWHFYNGGYRLTEKRLNFAVNKLLKFWKRKKIITDFNNIQLIYRYQTFSSTWKSDFYDSNLNQKWIPFAKLEMINNKVKMIYSSKKFESYIKKQK